MDPGEEARTLYAIAFIYIELGDREKALSHANRGIGARASCAQ